MRRKQLYLIGTILLVTLCIVPMATGCSASSKITGVWKQELSNGESFETGYEGYYVFNQDGTYYLYCTGDFESFYYGTVFVGTYKIQGKTLELNQSDTSYVEHMERKNDNYWREKTRGSDACTDEYTLEIEDEKMTLTSEDGDYQETLGKSNQDLSEIIDNSFGQYDDLMKLIGESEK